MHSNVTWGGGTQRDSWSCTRSHQSTAQQKWHTGLKLRLFLALCLFEVDNLSAACQFGLTGWSYTYIRGMKYPHIISDLVLFGQLIFRRLYSYFFIATIDGLGRWKEWMSTV